MSIQRQGILQSRAMDDLHVDCELAAIVIYDQDTDGTSASLKCIAKTRPKIRLVNDR